MDSAPIEQHKILIVEDDPLIMSFVSLLLESEGYDLVKAENGAEMFAALKAHDFDLVVLDIMLPDGNGVDFARQMRKIDTAVPILFATAVTDTDTKRRAAGLMQIDYVTKPFQADDLVVRIKALFDGSPVMEVPEEPRPAPPPVDDDGTSWYAAPLVWGPAAAFVFMVVAVLFLVPADDAPLAPEDTAQAATPSGATAADGTVTDVASGVVMKDSDAPVTIGGGAAAAGPAGGGRAGTGDEIAPEVKIAQACGQLPVSEYWNNNSVKRILRVVRFVHNGDWGAYVESWQERFVRVQDLDAQGQPVELQKKDIVLSGDDLANYLTLMEQRVKFLLCTQQIMGTVN